MAMYIRKGADLLPVPEDHEKILDQYRDSMPLVWEPQYFGDPYPFYPLIEEPAEDEGAPAASKLEAVLTEAARRLKNRRVENHGDYYVDYEALMRAVVEAVIREEYDDWLTGSEDPANPSRQDKADATAEARYMARKVQLFAAQVCQEITGAEMPSGTIRKPCMDTDDPEEAADLADAYPALPPVGVRAA
jgi:hypothetical protein